MLPDQLQNWVSAQIDQLQAKYPPNRVVAILLVALGAPLAALGGYLAVWVPKHFPGVPAFSPGQYTAFFIAGAGIVATAAITQAYRFVDGVQRHEEQVRAVASEEAQHAHTQHLEAMRLESEERRVALQSDNPHEALELLGMPVTPAPEATVAGDPPVGVAVPTIPVPRPEPDPDDEGPELTPEPGPLPHSPEDEQLG